VSGCREGYSHIESTCEYRNGCEWREQKAHEATISLETRKEGEIQ